MMSVSVDIDTAAIERLNGVLDRVANESHRHLAAETRRGAIYICQSLRARTKKAPKRARANEYRAVPSPNPPRYIHSNSAGHRLLRRWSLTRKLGTPDQYTYDHFVYTDARRGKGGRMVGKNAGAERRELLRLHGGIPRAGLAKISWGWIMKRISSGEAVDTAWNRTEGERRDPRRFVRGIFQATAGGAFAEIDNSLDYILDALKPGALDEAITAAANRLEHNINNHIQRAIS